MSGRKEYKGDHRCERTNRFMIPKFKKFWISGNLGFCDIWKYGIPEI